MTQSVSSIDAGVRYSDKEDRIILAWVADMKSKGSDVEKSVRAQTTSEEGFQAVMSRISRATQRSGSIRSPFVEPGKRLSNGAERA